MAYTDIYDAATTPNSRLRKQVAVALRKTAIDVSNEVGHPNGQPRKRWAQQARTKEYADQFIDQIVWLALEVPQIANNPTTVNDNVVQTAVDDLIDRLVGR